MTQQRTDSAEPVTPAEQDQTVWELKERIENLELLLAESEARYRIRNLEAVAFERDLMVKTAYVETTAREVTELREAVAWLQNIVSNLSGGTARTAVTRRTPVSGESRDERRRRQWNAAYEELCKHPRLLATAQQFKRAVRPNQP